MQERKRTVRAHAVREGDDLLYDAKWWKVKEAAVSGNGFATIALARGSREKGIRLHRYGLVKIIRRQ